MESREILTVGCVAGKMKPLNIFF